MGNISNQILPRLGVFKIRRFGLLVHKIVKKIVSIFIYFLLSSRWFGSKREKQY